MSSVKSFRKFVASIVSMSIPEELLPPSVKDLMGGSMLQVALGRPFDWAVNPDWHYVQLNFTNAAQTIEYEAHLWVDCDDDEDKLLKMFQEEIINRIDVPDYIGAGQDYPPMTPDDYIDDGDAWNPDLGEPKIKPGESGEIVEYHGDPRPFGTLDPDGRFAVSNERTVYTQPDITDREVPLGRCCHCDEREANHIILLPYRAPIDGTGWGCKNCDAPCDGAIAVTCTECTQEYTPHTLKDMELTVCVGFPADNVRVAKTEVIDRPYWHIESNWSNDDE